MLKINDIILFIRIKNEEDYIMQKQKNKQEAITLIALVVTIIILIILAGVSIAMVVGDNGIIAMAQRAKENTETAYRQEEQQLSELVERLEQETKGYNAEKKVNVPRLINGMTPIKFTDPTSSERGTVVETNSEDRQ